LTLRLSSLNLKRRLKGRITKGEYAIWLRLARTLGTANAATARLNFTFSTKTKPYPSANVAGTKLQTKK
jgi:hypothetical protein